MARSTIAALALCLLAGCGHPSTTPTTFHLKVDRDPANDDNRKETTIAFHPPARARIHVETDGDISSITFDSRNPNGERETVVRLVAERQENTTDGKARVETLVRPETPNGGSAGGPSTYVVDADKTLDEILNVTVTDSEYPLGAPVQIGTLNGKPIILVVSSISDDMGRP